MRSEKHITSTDMMDFLLFLAAVILTYASIVGLINWSLKSKTEYTQPEKAFNLELDYMQNYKFDDPEYKKAGYSSVMDMHSDLQAKRSEADGVAKEAITGYEKVISQEQIDILNTCESKMANALTINTYNKYLNVFNDTTKVLDEELGTLLSISDTASTSSGYSGGGSSYSSDPFNFRSAGVLYDSQYRYTYYSSNVLYHYRTSEWALGDDGIYRDSNGYVIVASDEYPQGTVVHSDIFGDCIVSDCGVGSSGTLDVYTGF